MLAGESPVLELFGHQVARSSAGGVTSLSEVALEQRGRSSLAQNRGPQAYDEPKMSTEIASPLSWMRGTGVPSPCSLGEGCYDTAIYRKQGGGELEDLGSSNPFALPRCGPVLSPLRASRVGSPVSSGWHVVKVSWSKAGGPCISGVTPTGKSVLKGKTGGADDGCMGVGGDHSTDDGEDNITFPEERVPTLTTHVEQGKTSIFREVSDA
jgi:hypothetical protein